MKNIFGNFQITFESKQSDITELERKYEINLPPIFRLFCETFVLNSLKPDTDHHIFHPNEELGFDGFGFSLNELLEYFQNVGEPYQKMKMLPIATSSIHSGGICVCFDSENMDKIFQNDEMANDGFVEIGKNIFDFVKELEQFKY